MELINTQYYEREEECNGSLIILRGEELYKNADNPDIEHWINSTKSISDMFISKGKKGLEWQLTYLLIFFHIVL